MPRSAPAPIDARSTADDASQAASNAAPDESGALNMPPRVGLFFLADAVYRGGPILATLDQPALVAATMGIVVTCIYLLGLLDRRDRTVPGMGIDSLGVLVAYGARLVALSALR